MSLVVEVFRVFLLMKTFFCIFWLMNIMIVFLYFCWTILPNLWHRPLCCLNVHIYNNVITNIRNIISWLTVLDNFRDFSEDIVLSSILSQGVLTQFSICLNPLSTTKWPNTLKQFDDNLLTNCLSVFDHFVKLALKGLREDDKLKLPSCWLRNNVKIYSPIIINQKNEETKK